MYVNAFYRFKFYTSNIPLSIQTMAGVSSKMELFKKQMIAVKKRGKLYEIYVILCKGWKIYVGRVNQAPPFFEYVNIRFKEHCAGIGSAWTNLWEPIEIIERIQDQSKWAEDTTVYRYMEVFGYENVRGGMFVLVELKPEQIAHLNAKFLSVNDKCFLCGSSTHFASRCTTPERKTESKELFDIKKATCFRCGCIGHLATTCSATVHVTGKPLASR